MKASDYTILATSERYRDVVAFWRGQLANADELTGAFARRVPESAPSTDARATIEVPIGPRAIGALDRLATDDLGRFAVLAAGIALAIQRYTNRSSVLLRTPLSADPNDLAGDAGEVPLVFSIAGAGGADGAVTLRAFIESAATVIEDSYTFQDFPIRTLAERDCGLDLGSADVSLSCAAIHGAAARPKSPLHFTVTAGRTPRIEVDSDPATIEAFLVEGLASLVAETLDRFDTLSTPVRDLPRLPASERERVLFEWNQTDIDAPFRSVHELFEDRARETPDAVAVRWGTDTITYRDLNARANRLARYLTTTASSDAERVVGIWMDRSPWMVVAVLGVLKSGRAYVPIDADVPADRLAFLIADSGVSRLLVDAHTGNATVSPACDLVAVDREMPGGDADLALSIDGSALAYVIYTSGSTGQPKGCAIEHHSLSNYLRWANGYYWTSADAGSMALFTPLAFDLTVPSLFCPLLRGRTLVVFPQDVPIHEALTRQFAAGSGVDAVKLTPSHIRVLGGASITRTDVRLVIVGGEALTAEQVAIVHRIDPRIRLVNEYGPTEATVGCVVKDVALGEPIVIGRPIANTQAYVLDADQAPVAIGIRGELCIGGEGVARGYPGRPELEADRFLANPFVPGGRIYRTGDIARWLPSGELECFGRMDSQVKVRGYRVEPGEIEAALRLCRGVRDAAVIAVGDDLVAYVVGDAAMDADAALDAGPLREALVRRLPTYMVPAQFVGLAELPMTANGKVDRQRLPARSAAALRSRPFVAPRNERERVIAGIWEALFRRDGIGVHDDFYEIGGHSLRAMALAQRLHQTLGLEVSIGEILAHPTIAALAALLESRAPTAARRIPRAPAAEHYPASHGQRRLWLIDRIEDGSPAYNVSAAFDLSGALDRHALATAFDALIARHESLRTVFIEVGDEPRQKVLPELRVDVVFDDLRADVGRESRLRELAAAQASAPFDLSAGPLLRVAVYQLEDDRAVLALTIHHIVSDAWSMRVLIADLITLYDSARSANRPAAAPLGIQYKDYAVWQRALLDGGGLRADESYWLTKLAGDMPVLDMPADFARPPVPTYRGRHFTTAIDGGTADRLRAFSIAHGASTFMTLVALVKALLFRYTGQTDIRVGSPIAGRAHVDTADQIGFFVNTLVLRDTVLGAETFVDLLARVKRTAEDAYEHQAFPFDRLVEALDVARDLSRSPLFDVMVVHDRESDEPVATGGLRVSELRLDSGISKFDLTFAFAESPEGIAVEIEYRTDLFTDRRVQTMAAQLVQLAGEVVAKASTPIERLDVTGLSEITAASSRSGRANEAAAHGLPAAAAANARPHTPVAPRDERELALVGVLESVLGHAGVGVSDNFFHIGGDSIKAIQVVNRLGRHGWTLRVRDLFEAPEVAALARRLTPSTRGRRGGIATGALAAGDVPLTPIQHWFFQTQPEDRAHFNQSVMLRFPERLDEASLRLVGRALTAHHASLRLRYEFAADGIRQSYANPSDSANAGYDPVETHDLRGEADAVAALGRLAAAAQGGFDLGSGRLAKVVLFRLPDADRLLAVIHHLAVDGVSWRVLLQDLRTGLAQASRGEPVHLGEPSESYQAWSLALEARARAAMAAGPASEEAAWWNAVDRTAGVLLPYDRITDDIRESEATEARLTLSVEDTTALLSRVHQAYNTRIQDVLLAALAGAAREWAGPGPMKVDVESHGRDGLDGFASLDVSRSVGWFTSLYPVVLDIGDQRDVGRRLIGVKDALRRTPGHGVGYGLLRRGAPSGAAVLFNFLGQFDTDVAGLEIADEDRGPEVGPATRMTHALVIGGWIAEGRLNMTVRFSRRQFDDDTIGRFASAYQRGLEEIIAHCRARATRERTLSDYRYADATTPQLVERLGADRIDDIYTLSPMQLGMLYHAALDAGYLEIFAYAITGPLDAVVFRAAWERAIARHTALRTAFFWRDVAEPVQVVFAHVDTPWTFPDWRALSAAEQDARLAAFVDDERRKGLRLDSPPLLRFTLARLANETYRFFWTAHHLILDGWSTAIVVQEVMADYQATVAGAGIARGAAREYGEYIDWLRSHDATASDAYWRARLQDFSTPTPLPGAVNGSGEPGPRKTSALRLSRDATAILERVARDNALTLNTVTRGVWALVLAAHSGRTDVVFGATVAGRPADLPDVETMVGLFINTLPIRVRVETAAPVVSWLRRLQIEQASLDQHAFGSLADIQRASAVPPRTALFESVLVFENYPDDQSVDASSLVAVEELPAVDETNYPLTLIVGPARELMLRLSYDTSRYDPATAQALLAEMRTIFESIGRDPQQAVGALLGRDARQGPAAARHTFPVGAQTMAALGTIADREATDIRSVANALVAVLAFRYAANEDLACALGSTPLSREGLGGTDDFGAVLRSAASRPAQSALGDDTAAFDLRFTIGEVAEASQGRPAAEARHPLIDVRCETGRFGDAFLARVESHLDTLAAAIAAHPLDPISHLPLLSAGERSTLIDEFNRTGRHWGAERTIVQYFEAQASTHPDRPAVRLPAIGRDGRATDDVWSYGELNARANQVAHLLVREYGVGPDVRVGVLAERSLEMVLALVAIEKAGGAYVPLDPDYPRDLLQFMMEDSGAAVILTVERFRDLVADRHTPLVCLDSDAATFATERRDDLPSQVSGDDLAYVIYTSGSTGRPKGAMNTHRGIANRLLWMQDTYPLTERDRVLQKTPFSFDVSVWEFFWPLMVGAELVVAKPGGHRDAAYLVALINDAAITTLHFVPSMLQAFIEEPGVERCRSLTRVICSGEAVTPELLRRYLAKIDVPLYNLYGPTEAAVDVTAWPLTAADTASMVPIGKPIANTQIYILDDRLQPVPLGVTGELFIGGVGVGRGYLNRDELTAAKFVPDPFRAFPGARLYRTGDLARQREDGVVDFLGRIDHQVKLRGFRIELGEIESALLAHPGVRECVVLVREDQPGQKRLVAYVVLASGAGDVPADLSAHLHARLASHMVPAVIAPLDELPRLTNGKLDRKALPAPEERLDDKRRHVAPRGAVERRLVRIWEEVLGQSAIGVTDDFFERGGHSILAMRLVSAIELEFGRSVPLAQLLSHPTIERLAVALKTTGDDWQDWRPLVEIRRGRGAPLFLLPGAGGNVIYFHALAAHLATTRPIYGLQAVGLDGRTPPLATVEAIAATNIEEMRRAWPAGPYLIVGHSFGGRVALEMSQQLLRQGLPVQLLGVLDTAAPTFQPDQIGVDWTDAHWLAKIAREIEEFFDITLGVTMDELAPLPLDAQLALVVDRMQRAGAWAPGANAAQLRGYLEVYKAHTQAAFVDYDATAARVPIALFKALERDPDIDRTPAGLEALQAEDDWGWRRFAEGSVQVFDVPGAHLSMLTRPHVVALARALDAALAAAERV